MEDILQRIFSVIIAVLILFILPLYIAFEKKDDIAYALSLKITTSFVNNVTSKGYLTLDMYDKFISDLSVTDNIYDIKLEYVAKKYNPIIQVYEEKDGKPTNNIKEYDYLLKKVEYDNYIKNNNTDIIRNSGITANKVQLTYKLSEELQETQQILDTISDGKLEMNEGDQFNVIIKNKNTTFASVLFNTLTFGANTGNDTKVYINYGGTIKNQEYDNKSKI